MPDKSSYDIVLTPVKPGDEKALLSKIKQQPRLSEQRVIDVAKSSANKKSIKLKEKLDALKAKCHQAGLKITPQRMAVYRVLIQTNKHPSAEAVLREVRNLLPNISLDTVNRTLLTLSEIGAAFVVEGSGDAKRFDGDTKNHQHFRCIKCKRIIDFHYQPFDDIPVPKSICKNFVVLRKTVYFEGLCDLCKKK